jgi:hypothetical protein
VEVLSQQLPYQPTLPFTLLTACNLQATMARMHQVLIALGLGAAVAPAARGLQCLRSLLQCSLQTTWQSSSSSSRSSSSSSKQSHLLQSPLLFS